MIYYQERLRDVRGQVIDFSIADKGQVNVSLVGNGSGVISIGMSDFERLTEAAVVAFHEIYMEGVIAEELYGVELSGPNGKVPQWLLNDLQKKAVAVGHDTVIYGRFFATFVEIADGIDALVVKDTGVGIVLRFVRRNGTWGLI